MDCKTAKSMLLPFLRDELSPEEVDDFTRHLKDCKHCREDLEIYYIVQMGISGLNSNSFSTFNLKEQFEREVSRKTAEAHRHLLLRNASQVLSMFAILISLLVGASLLMRWF